LIVNPRKISTIVIRAEGATNGNVGGSQSVLITKPLLSHLPHTEAQEDLGAGVGRLELGGVGLLLDAIEAAAVGWSAGGGGGCGSGGFAGGGG
jgi:hypothetical protein